MAIMTHAKFHFSRLMVTLIFDIRASELPPPPPPTWRTTQEAEPDRFEVDPSNDLVDLHKLNLRMLKLSDLRINGC